MAHIWVDLPQDESGYPPCNEEELHARKVADHQFQVVSTPVFATEIAVDDIIETQTFEGREWATQVLEPSGRWCARIVPFNNNPMEPIVAVFASMGVNATATSYGLVTLDIPAEIDAEHVMTELQTGFDEGDWDYEIAVKPAPSPQT